MASREFLNDTGDLERNLTNQDYALDMACVVPMLFKLREMPHSERPAFDASVWLLEGAGVEDFKKSFQKIDLVALIARADSIDNHTVLAAGKLHRLQTIPDALQVANLVRCINRNPAEMGVTGFARRIVQLLCEISRRQTVSVLSKRVLEKLPFPPEIILKIEGHLGGNINVHIPQDDFLEQWAAMSPDEAPACEKARWCRQKTCPIRTDDEWVPVQHCWASVHHNTPPGQKAVFCERTSCLGHHDEDFNAQDWVDEEVLLAGLGASQGLGIP